MTHQSNWDAKTGSNNPGLTAEEFKKKFGMTDTQAQNASRASNP